MRNKFYKCDDCGQKFGQKWNALRHTKLIHGATSNIISNDIKPRTLYKSHNRFYNYEKKFNILYQSGIEVYNEYNSSDIFNLDKIDFKIIKILDQLIKPFNELEELLIDIDINDKTRAFILLRSFDVSLQSHNPVSSMNEMVELLRSINGIKKIAKYESLVARTSIDHISNIKEKIKNSYIFERQNN